MREKYSAKALQDLVSQKLLENGFSYIVGNDMQRWRELRMSKGARIPSPFNPRFCDQSQSRFVSILDGNENVVATRAWRTIETESFVQEVESGKIWMDNPKSFGFSKIHSGLDPRSVHTNSGWISIGGAMESFVPGKAFSWYLGSLHWVFATMEDVDYTVTTAFPDIANADIPIRRYGYKHRAKLPTHYFPHVDETHDLTLYWSSKNEALEEIRSRVELLRAANTQDLKASVTSRDRVQIAEKLPFLPV
ncbi:MAG: hypothetical protein ISP41_06265 [Alphaproteobacteria bacterium]|nr:hypothetical protein [Alphaproteobacteria bacterium]